MNNQHLYCSASHSPGSWPMLPAQYMTTTQLYQVTNTGAWSRGHKRGHSAGDQDVSIPHVSWSWAVTVNWDQVNRCSGSTWPVSLVWESGVSCHNRMKVTTLLWFYYSYHCYHLDKVVLSVERCEGLSENWKYVAEDKMMTYSVHYTDDDGNDQIQTVCVELQGLRGLLKLNICDKENSKQLWNWEEYKPYWAMLWRCV